MKKIFFVMSLVFTLASCSVIDHKSRDVASDEGTLNGTLLGVAKYRMAYKAAKKKFGWKKAKKMFHTKRNRAVRIYLNEIEGEKGSYHCILLEYVNLVKMAPKYIASNKMPRTSKVVGFLNQITKRITVYKVFPGAEEGTYEMQKIKVAHDKLETANGASPSKLVLSKKKDLVHPLEGATITTGIDGEPVELYFPITDEKESFGLQYNMAKFTYKKVKLESTWRKNFLSGPYLGAYGDKKDEVLRLTRSEAGNTAKFKINKSRSKLKPKKREKQFTNAKSAYLVGEYSVTEPGDGMFVFTSLKSADEKGREHVEGKIGLFIDIFDATKSLNQDVVELVLVDSDKPEDFLMYYEHPDNGEGTKKSKR